MVGGIVIETKEMGMRTATGVLYRLWVMDGFDELCVLVKIPFERWVFLPGPGEQVWWQGNRLYYANDKVWLERFGAAYRPSSEDYLEYA